MGARIDFTCPACGLTGHVSGGEDCGMDSSTTTIYCITCDRLLDVVTGLHLDTENARRLEPRCPKHPSHPIRLWNSDEPCPRCGKAMMKMDDDGKCTLWD